MYDSDGFPVLRAKLGQLFEKEPNLTAGELGSIKARTVIADGEHEQFIAREHSERLARLIPGVRLLILPNVSHGGPQQDPVSFHRSVTALLNSLAIRASLRKARTDARARVGIILGQEAHHGQRRHTSARCRLDRIG
ncbi:hypothetical protein GG804_18290 [Sphingomonas histidinilytica]|uniref:alpha/beta fold hydrolase n=1 Tax=Rhizorhabdus histidinilytica TaxID=439228 RepID=UPI001ADBDEF1|nr:alpha/beta hydrolase [Rhizorhabdus histidinilytica]MBO9378722.1 hypothetical protein [Rhizorhabdus histidinilytica]